MSNISLLVEEEIKALKRIEEAKKEAEKIVEKAKEEARKIKDLKLILEKVSKYIDEQEKLLKEEAESLRRKYFEIAEKIRLIPSEEIDKIAEEIVMEVVGLERGD